MTASLALGPVPGVRLARINPVAQLTAVGVVTLTLLTSLDVVTPAVVLAAELCLFPAAGLVRPGVVWRRTWPVLVGASSVAVVNVLLAEDAGVVTGVGLALRVVGLALPGVLLVASTDPVRLADALTLHWRVPTRFAFGALAAVRLAPLLVAEFEAIRLARRTRGVDAGRNPVAAVRLLAGAGFTLLVGAVRRATRLATAMDARGFDSGVRRTNARGSVLHARDTVFVAATVAVCAAAVGLGLVLGTWDPVFVGG
ncbi:energy-coupling factor transporter transmembrane protein EcfT [Geodermatophilus sp. YIM 151500]|uniref:energy-coupling factor transporter transmembrane component T family protein n=1 Tax=Geodermatophilus sp. YIM 151500 TaxID=2984531 RepID=UPI0021E392BA|nr:energy-coupling factor transporter transmembrane component T [Geodermatophilus sp. YIM 151500]MCV2491190.1 energy-coupling factor transporter transmembrane protein EcfT [Geodermatophilus sp. YIM 151500]